MAKADLIMSDPTPDELAQAGLNEMLTRWFEEPADVPIPDPKSPDPDPKSPDPRS